MSLREPDSVVIHAPHLMNEPPIPPAPAAPWPAPVKLEPERKTGLGDIVAKVADPIARALDKHVGTSISGCSACSRRRQILNKIIPDITKPLSR